MPDGNVEIVRGMTRALCEGDVDYAIRHTTPDVFMIMARSAVEGPFVGHDGVRRFFADNAENFDMFELNDDEVRSIGADRVLSVGTVRVRGRGGGVETDIPFAGITTFRDGKVARWEDFRQRDLALRAARLAG
jgi:ketosteroid isomerase-like protein